MRKGTMFRVSRLSSNGRDSHGSPAPDEEQVRCWNDLGRTGALCSILSPCFNNSHSSDYLDRLAMAQDPACRQSRQGAQDADSIHAAHAVIPSERASHSPPAGRSLRPVTHRQGKPPEPRLSVAIC